jgi:methylated-DNA-[protein]-cysteine S-methyltransferase
MRLAYHVMSSPLGLLFLARTERGLRYLEFMDRKSLKRMIGGHEVEAAGARWEPSLLELKSWVDQLEEYFNATRGEFTLPLDPVGSEFQLAVWAELKRIPFGETRSYLDIAKAVGQPKAARAVGLANNQNPIAIVVPCHRVIGTDGKMVGYGGGVQRKRWLLDHEARVAQPVGRTLDLFSPPAAVHLAKREAAVAALVRDTSQARGGARPAPAAARASAPRAASAKPAAGKSAAKSGAPRVSAAKNVVGRSSTSEPRGASARPRARATARSGSSRRDGRATRRAAR